MESANNLDYARGIMGSAPSKDSASAVGTLQANAAQACPVDDKTREAWLDLARTQGGGNDAQRQALLAHLQQQQQQKHPSEWLPTDRQVSSIPRVPSHPPQQQQQQPQQPSNHEQETGASASGHWIYPSQQQFFAALQRKQLHARAEDMATIVPIHNAVNEQAWRLVCEWERGRGAEQCGGPRLASFQGKNNNSSSDGESNKSDNTTTTASVVQLTPRAWWNVAVLGYAPPFDRHDWVVERCVGEQVEYVIDFYQGKAGADGAKPVGFYLDVRPKLNSWEGWKMRLGHMVGV